MSLEEQRTALLADQSQRGAALCRSLSNLLDAWLIELFQKQVGDRDDMALICVGGYGRAEQCPQSDLDLLLLHDNAADIAEVAEQLWYPVWDERVKLGHAVRTPKEALSLAAEDLETATAMLSARHLAGSPKLTADLRSAATERWQKDSKRWLLQLADAVDARTGLAGEVAFLLEPDLKEARGGLRDVHALAWAKAADPELADPAMLASEYEVILAARAELGRVTGRRGDRLLLEEQDAVAANLGYEDADVMMADIAASARRISWLSDRAWAAVRDRLTRRKARLRRPQHKAVGFGVEVVDSEVILASDHPITAEAVLTVALAASENDAIVQAETLERLGRHPAEFGVEWTADTLKLFVKLLACGHVAIPHIETLDQLGLFVPLIPEWAPNRNRPQRNVYHRFTVDRHLWEAAAEASELVDRVARPDLLLIGALLHDVGKGYPGDHTEVGMELVQGIGTRMGFSAHDVDTLVAMVEHHLLIPDVATRRDINDPETLQAVADQAGTVERLELLSALTVADSIATGPAAWSKWKANLVRELTERTRHLMVGGDVEEFQQNFPTPEDRERMRRGTVKIEGSGDTLTVMAIDRPGLFYRSAGALSLNGLDVAEAAAHSEFGMALSRFRVTSSFPGAIDWDKVAKAVERALEGRLAIDARLDQRRRTYAAGRASVAPQRIVETTVTIDNESSSQATVVEVAAPNNMGLLYRITRLLAGMNLSILSAKVQTLGDDVVDSFYLVDREGRKVVDQEHLAELEMALLHVLAVH